ATSPIRRHHRHRLCAARNAAARRGAGCRTSDRGWARHAAPPGGARFRGLGWRAARGHSGAPPADRGDALMLKLGLTGSIASGKSTVLEEFAALGVPVFSADEAVHALYAGEAVPAVEALFPGVSHNGQIDRTALSRQLLEQPQRLK